MNKGNESWGDPNLQRKSDELAAMCRMLSASDGVFSFSLAICDRPSQRESLINEICGRFGGISRVRIHRESCDIFSFVRENADENCRAGVFVIGLEEAVTSADDAGILRDMNSARELWKKTFSCPVVFWVPEYVATLLSEYSRDLWSWISPIFEFAAEESTQAVSEPQDFTASDAMSSLSFSYDEKLARIAELEERERVAQEDGTKALDVHRIGWLQELGHLEFSAGRLDKAEEAYRRVLELATGNGDEGWLSEALNSLGVVYRTRGDLAGAEDLLKRALELQKGPGRADQRARTYGNLANLLFSRGDLAEAVEYYNHAMRIIEQLVEKEGRRELRNDLASCYSNRGNALRNQGKLSEAISDYGVAIEIREQLVEKEGRRELRNDLASCYNNRGNALADQGKLPEAIADYGLAIKICEQLVDKEGRRELRNDLASCYNNRGLAFRAQRKLSEAISDYGVAIEIREQLVTQEGRRELRWDLYSSLFNRAVARTQTEEWEGAGEDIDKGGGMLRELIGEGQRHVLGSCLRMAGFRCAYAEQFGDIAKAAQWANDAMRWFVEEVRAGRGNEMLLKAAGEFLGHVEGNLEALLENGLDKELWESFRGML